MGPNEDTGRTDDEQQLTPDLPPPVEGVPEPEPGPASGEDRGGDREDGDRGAREESDAPEHPG